MAAFRAAGCTRPLIVEVKKVFTDRGRMLLLQLLRWEKICRRGLSSGSCATCCAFTIKILP
jgi:hypothetical protein